MHEPRHVTAVDTAEAPQLRQAVDARRRPAVAARDGGSSTRESDVVLKLSRVEGMFGPPLEGFHMGATCVVTPVTGHDEYVEHGENGLVVDWDDLRGTARALDLLARDRALLHRLRWGALATARGWPSWEQQGTVMAAALAAIASRAPPPGRRRSGADAGRLRARARAPPRATARSATSSRDSRNRCCASSTTARVQQTLRARHHRAVQPVCGRCARSCAGRARACSGSDARRAACPARASAACAAIGARVRCRPASPPSTPSIACCARARRRSRPRRPPTPSASGSTSPW